MRVEKGGDLLLQDVSLEDAEELFGFGEGQPELLDALIVFGEGDDIGNRLFMTVIVTDNELQCDAHTGASPGSSGQGIGQAILPEFCSYPQHLPALHGFQPYASGFVPLSMVEFSL